MKEKRFVVIVVATMVACLPALDTRAADELAEVRQTLAAIDAEDSSISTSGDGSSRRVSRWEIRHRLSHCRERVISQRSHSAVAALAGTRYAARPGRE